MMTVFIAFNYLLLDREKTTKNIENLKYNNDSQSGAIEVLSNDIKNSKDKITGLNKTIQTLEDSIKELDKTNSELKLNEINSKISLEKKNNLIDKIKVQIGIEPFEEAIKKWADNIDKGQYEVAYEMYPKGDNGLEISLEEYSNNFKANIKNLKLKSLKIQTEEVKGVTEGNIVFIATLDLKLIEKPSSTSYVEGLNERLFAFDYDKTSDKWTITEIMTK